MKCCVSRGCGMGPWLVLVSPCFRENVVATCKIGSFLCSLDNLLQKNVIGLFFGNQISKWRSFEKQGGKHSTRRTCSPRRLGGLYQGLPSPITKSMTCFMSYSGKLIVDTQSQDSIANQYTFSVADRQCPASVTMTSWLCIVWWWCAHALHYGW